MPDDQSPEELWFGDFGASIDLFEQVYFQEGLARSKGQISPRAARAFAQGLILEPSVESARERMRRDPKGAEAFYEVAVDVRNDSSDRPLSGVHRASDGQHEPFLLLAAAVLNRLGDTDELE